MLLGVRVLEREGGGKETNRALAGIPGVVSQTTSGTNALFCSQSSVESSAHLLKASLHGNERSHQHTDSTSTSTHHTAALVAPPHSTMLSGMRVARVGSNTLRRNAGVIRPRHAAAAAAGSAGELHSSQHTPLPLAATAGATTTRRAFSTARAALPKASELPSYVLNCPETQVTTLPNGLRVASEVRPSTSTSHCGV